MNYSKIYNKITPIHYVILFLFILSLGVIYLYRNYSTIEGAEAAEKDAAGGDAAGKDAAGGDAAGKDAEGADAEGAVKNVAKKEATNTQYKEGDEVFLIFKNEEGVLLEHDVIIHKVKGTNLYDTKDKKGVIDEDISIEDTPQQ